MCVGCLETSAGALQVLTGKAKQEAEEAQRILCGALNGLAALHLLDQDPGKAIQTYRQVCPF